jgi:hypothetical protein
MVERDPIGVDSTKVIVVREWTKVDHMDPGERVNLKLEHRASN